MASGIQPLQLGLLEHIKEARRPIPVCYKLNFGLNLNLYIPFANVQGPMITESVARGNWLLTRKF
jgi:hypothetical protein